jgi:hypothetical protein
MRKEALAHEMVRLNGALDVVAVDTDGDTHEHVLGTFGNATIDTEQVRALEGLESEAANER